MIRHILRTVFLLTLLVILPLVPRPTLLLSWPVLVTIMAGMFLNLSQPPVSADDLAKKDGQDRRSVLFLYIFGCLSFLAPVLDYGYGRMARPSACATWSIVGFVCVVAGLAYRYWAIRTLGKFFTSVVRVQEGQTVIQTGPYKMTRHPSYLGAWIMMIGISITLRSYVGLVVFLLGLVPTHLYRISVEEAVLVRELGVPYEEYRKRSRRLIPFLY